MFVAYRLRLAYPCGSSILTLSIMAVLHYYLVTFAHLHSLPGSIIAALVVGALFDPVMQRIQHFVNGWLPSGGSGGPRQPEEAKAS